jgi:hypothetical protein
VMLAQSGLDAGRPILEEAAEVAAITDAIPRSACARQDGGRGSAAPGAPSR